MSSRSLTSYILQSCKKYPNQPAFVIRRKVRREVITYGELPLLYTKLQLFFKQNRITEKTKILIWGMNSPEYAVLLSGCFLLNRIAIPIDFRTGEETLTNILVKTAPSVAFISKYLRSTVVESQNIRIFYLEDLFALLPTAQKVLPLPKLSDEQTAELVFTSGTTGVPKGVIQKIKNITQNVLDVEPSLPEITNARMLSLLPLSHMYEQIVGLLIPLGHGATIFYLPRVNSFRMLQAFAEYRPTHQIFVPQLLKVIWQKIEMNVAKQGVQQQFSQLLSLASFLPFELRRIIFQKVHTLFGGSLKIIASGGAPLDPIVGRNWQSLGFRLIEGYGATEVTAIATINPIDKPKISSAGKPMPGVSISFSETQEIVIGGNSVAGGYYKDPERTKQAFTARGYRTGDIGEFDDQGYLHIKGRDVFKIVLSSGEKVFVEDLEAKILKNQDVADVCVVAKRIADGDQIYALFLLKESTTATLEEIVAQVNATLESKQQILHYERWKEKDFPRTHTLKVDRKAMSAYVNAKPGEAVVPSSTSAQQFYDILDVLSNVSGFEKSAIQNTDRLSTDLSLDSLSRAELVSRAEEYLGIIIDESKITGSSTVADLKHLAESAEHTQVVTFPTWQFTRMGQFIHRLALRYVLIPLHSLLIQIDYPQKKVPRILPGSIVIFNHPGVADGACVLRALEAQGQTKMVTNVAEEFWNPRKLMGQMFELMFGGIPLYESGQRLLKILSFDSDLLDAGYNLILAPQGTIQRQDREPPFKLGLGYFVQSLDRPVSIVKIEGYREIWPAPSTDIIDSKFTDLLPKKRGTVRVKISPPIKRDWSTMTIAQITNFLEEEYHRL